MSPFDTEQETNELLAKCDSILAENPGNRCCKYLKEYVKSDEFKKWQGFTLSASNRLQVLIPPSFGNGHVVLTETAIFHYKQTTYYNRDGQFMIKWNDPNYNFWWPVKNPILSERDE